MESQTDYLISLLEEEGYRHLSGSLPALQEKHLKQPDYMESIEDIYEQLGGIQSQPPLQPRPYDAEFEHMALMLDDDRYFNRYRQITLRAGFYKDLPGFPLQHYRQYCRQYEKECIKIASKDARWTSPESEYYFGKSEAPGDLGLNGSAAWKMRAFQDMLTDLGAYLSGIKIIRVSVHDKIMANKEFHSLKNLLLSRHEQSKGYLKNYLLRIAEPGKHHA